MGPCAGTKSCLIFGKCTPINGVCMAGTNADCEQSQGCKEDGECMSADLPYDEPENAGKSGPHLACWKPASSKDDCRVSRSEDEPSQCRGAGRCRPVAGICTAGTQQDCEQSEACKEWGACAYKNGECWRGATTSADCSVPFGPNNESSCSLFGFCKNVDGVCMTGTDDDCLNAFVCKQWGECKAYDGECWQSAE